MRGTALSRWQRAEAGLHLAMLPVGGTLVVVSAAAFVVVLALAIVTPFLHGRDWGWTEAWAVAAAAVAMRNTHASIETMSALDWKTALGTFALSAIAVAACPIGGSAMTIEI